MNRYLKNTLKIFIRLFIVVVGAWLIRGLYVLVRKLWTKGRG